MCLASEPVGYVLILTVRRAIRRCAEMIEVDVEDSS
jgi:hypothetical protein